MSLDGMKAAWRIGVVGVVGALLVLQASIGTAFACDATGLRVGGEPADLYIGPTCNEDGTYRTTFYVTGSSLPATQTADTQVTIEGVAYPVVFFQQVSAGEVVLGINGIPGGAVATDVSVQLAAGCSISVPDLYLAPECVDTCEVLDFRTGGQQGDNYIGPTCNDGDGTYRTTFYVSGNGLPTTGADVVVTVDGVEYPATFFQVLSGTQLVIGVPAIPEGMDAADVTIQVRSGCSLTKLDLYDPPACSCVIDGVRVGGEQGDLYIGPTCNEDETYRTCYYVMGDWLPYQSAEATLTIEGMSYPIAFFQRLSPQEVVVCATDIAEGPVATDVAVQLRAGCAIDVPDLYDGPTCQHVPMCTDGPSGVCQVPSPTDDGVGAVESVTGDALAADAFTPTVDADVTHLTWWGVYGRDGAGSPTECGPGTGDDFSVTYYLDDGGLPGAVLAGPMPLTNLAKCTTGASVQLGTSTLDEYRYEADHAPVAIEAGTTYWVEIGNVVPDATCRWRWRTSSEGDGGHAIDTGTEWEAGSPDLAFCYNTIRQTCRSAGYFMTHSSAEGGSRDVTGELLAAAGCLEICGEVIRNTLVDDADSAVEALCESPRSTPERQLARQLTALGLNCIASGYGPLCHGWPGVEDLFAECNAVCELGPNGMTVDECIAAVACVNEGGQPFAGPGTCYDGTCSDNGALCSARDKSGCDSPTLATCDPLPGSCHDLDVCNPGVGVCVPPGTPANATSCKAAKMSACSILEVGRTTELDCAHGIRLDEETCCHDPSVCDDGEPCTADQCIVGPGCDNEPIPLCCEENADCSNPLPTCDLATNTCMECISDVDCDDGIECTSDVCIGNACSWIPDGPVVSPPCQACHCEVGVGEVCTPIADCCVTDADCFDPDAPHCTASNVCAECAVDPHCDDDDICTTDSCQAGTCANDAIPGCCHSDADCADPTPVCLPDNRCSPGAEDTCGNPGTVDCDASATFDNSTFVTEADDPAFSCHFGGAAQGVGTAWFTFVATDTSACLDTNGSAVADTILAVYDGTCGSLSELGCSDDEGVGLLSELCVDGLTVGNTYYAQVASFSAASQGSITLSVTCPAPGPPPGDTCAVPAAIECGGTATFDNSTFVTDPSDPAFSCHFGGAAQGVGTAWFSFMATGTMACLDTNDSAVADTLLAVYDGTCGSFTELECSEDEGVGLLSELCVDGLTVGNTYYAQVASYSAGSQGSITLNLTCETPSVCGDGVCDVGEESSPDYCAADCCGDGTCSPAEAPGPDYCEVDCCGDGSCAAGEGSGPRYCAADCCGDGNCTATEADDPTYCAADCCGDGTCSASESTGVLYCAQDCCGDATCAPEEDEFTCPTDCLNGPG